MEEEKIVTGEAPAPEAQQPQAARPYSRFEGPDPVRIKKRGFTDNIFVIFFAAFLLMSIGGVLGEGVNVIPGADKSADWLQIAIMYATTIGVWIVFILFFLISQKNRPILKALGGKPQGNNFGMFMLGLLIFGFGANALCILAAWLHGDIFLTYYTFEPVKLLIIFLCVFVQSSSEELVCRAFIYQRLRRSYRSPWVAIIGNAALFGFLHVFNPGVTPLAFYTIIAVGILYSLMVYYTNSIWCAIAAHTMWNFTQNIIFGLPNSGIVSPYSIFMLDAAKATDSFAYNVGFGVEGTLLEAGLLTLACVVYCIWGRKHGQPEFDIWGENKCYETAEQKA